MGEAVDLTNDPELVKVLTEAVGNVEGMTARQDPMNFGGSEDATILARRVQARIEDPIFAFQMAHQCFAKHAARRRQFGRIGGMRGARHIEDDPRQRDQRRMFGAQSLHLAAQGHSGSSGASGPSNATISDTP